MLPSPNVLASQGYVPQQMPISSAYAPTWPPQEPQLSPNAIKHRDLIIAGEGQSVVIDDWSMLTGARRVTADARGATTLIVDDTAAKKDASATLISEFLRSLSLHSRWVYANEFP